MFASTVDFRLSLDFFDSGLYTCTAVARLTLVLAKLSCFTNANPQMVEGWVDLDGWLDTQTVYLSAVTDPSTNRAQCRLTSLNKANALTTALSHQPLRVYDSMRVLDN